MADIVCCGELLIDFISQDRGKNIIDANLFMKRAGGAPANVAVGVSKLGGSSAFIGKVGRDSFGKFLKHTLDGYGVTTDNLLLTDSEKTTLAFVAIDSGGDRSFEFYRDPGADSMLQENEIDINMIKAAKIFHFGSISLIKSPSREATLEAAKTAKDSKILVSYDPNLRLNLWESPEKAKAGMMEGMEYADILKISEEELEFLTGDSNMEKSCDFFHGKGISYIFVTLGEKGCFYSTKEFKGHVEGKKVKVVDTTGAGDAFTAGMLVQFVKNFNSLDNLSQDNILEMVTFANNVGAITTTKFGAMDALPYFSDLV